MKIDFVADAGDAALIVLPAAKDGLGRVVWGTIDAGGQALAAAAAAAARFEGKAGSIAELFLPGEPVRRLLLLGIGAGEEADWEKAGGALTARLLTSGASDATVDLAALPDAPTPAAVARFAGAAAQRAWRHDIYRTKLPDHARPTLSRIAIAGAPEAIDAAWAGQDAVTQGMALTRTLVAEPPNILYPETFVDQVTKSIDGLGLAITVLDEAAMRELGMGALLGVSQGSVREARVLALAWQGAGEGDPALALVGKGVTFDTGGISLKPGPGMEDMKWDMGGAGAVVGAMKALAARKAKANVVGVVGLVENMPDGNAQRPGDVVTSMSGQTIEVLNTDAEGRLVLADVITWTQRIYRPKTIIDLATLTGAMIVTLGHHHGGLFANDDALADALLAAGKASGDLLWRLPLAEAYDKMIDSPIADMKNIGGKGAGSITAAQFIKRFVDEGVAWAHLDIAGMVWADKPGATYDKGATGYGVRLLDRYVAAVLEGGELQVDFYHLTATPIERALPRIAERVVAGGDRLLVVAGDAERCAAIDGQLWSYAANSFLPHARAGGEADADQPVLIAETLVASNGARMVALADGEWRDEALGFDRAFHFFDDQSLTAARAAWRALAGRGGVERRYWKQDERGRWEQAA